MADQAEFAFIKTFVNTISTQPITYDDEYQQPPENSLKKVPVLTGVAVPEPPARKVEETAAGSSSTTLNLLIKSTKPPITYTLSGIHPTDTISAIKQHLSTTNPTAPAPDAQRLLLKGKALADNKLLKEYPVKDGDTINLMVKPGVEWNPAASAADPPVVTLNTPAPKPAFGTSLSSSLLSGGSPAAPSGHTGKRHQRIPSVVLSPSPSNEDELGAQPRKDVLLTLDTTDLALGTGSTPKETLGAYHLTISSPGFWDKLIQFLRTEFTNESDALTAFEDFLAASKGYLREVALYCTAFASGLIHNQIKIRYNLLA
ncbi:ubiquitin family protein [Lentinula edodes]|uniref:Ubiquitin family protein n=1 Tax=Lentinula edodes TaxID=5353 RepID=A0A1Q3E2V8_LENED|nr:ubiquitin family protein [Lentinula edodes]